MLIIAACERCFCFAYLSVAQARMGPESETDITV